ncbi:MAG: hypothetical protein ACW986_09020 [Promethearchaeota archaeon]
MREDIGKRLHRVRITPVKNIISCPKSKHCGYAENCTRCNIFYRKCHKFNTLE